ncbi:MAG: 2-amino-4-hydroxy-6-hydroxymethyldihydropteridine diphosphokinase [Candidatus Omnitrophica bacterium]|nr:2-amino-4-hydroxy-6-hydroxymethyldihydropteridine diphosphokinase [Candidatus Omnitrophota bacterium]
MITSYIALGSNLGDRAKNINLALKYLKQNPSIEILKISSIIETEPQKAPPQPKFLNGVVKLKTSYSASQLLKKLQEIEIKLGREVPRLKNQPRTIDLDVLLYGDSKIEEKDLQIPHPRMWKRRFVTIPLKEIAPELF